MKLYCRHVACMAPFDTYTPKYHIMFHLVKNIEWHGNPNAYATWLDESLSRVLKAACKNASTANFGQTDSVKMRDLLR